MRNNKVFAGLLLLIIFAIVASGCVFGPSGEETTSYIDPPQEDYTEGDSTEIVLDLEESDEPASEASDANKETQRTLYLFDHQGRVVPFTVTLPYTEGTAKQALEYLVVDGPVTELLPNGMRAVLPAGTELTVAVKDGTAVVDFSNEFKNYKAEDEKGILEAITWTLTQFDTIQNVSLQINGYPIDVMPVNNTPIGKSVSRKDGINIEIAEGTRVGNSSVVTIYFKAQNPAGTFEYFVPVSRVVPRNSNLVEATIKELIAGPQLGSNLFTDLVDSTKVKVSVDGNMATLDFDEQFLIQSEEKPKASDDALQSIVLSLTESGLVQQVQFMVNGESSNLVSFEGKDLTKPVSRPVTINSTGF